MNGYRVRPDGSYGRPLRPKPAALQCPVCGEWTREGRSCGCGVTPDPRPRRGDPEDPRRFSGNTR